MFVPAVAEAFQEAGITALIYDPRHTGDSEGLPRQDIDPLKQAADYSDALTYLAGLPMVNPKQIVFWGFSFAGQVALTAASLDKRASHIIAVCPITDFTFGGKRTKVLAKAMKDRESQLAGNPPFTIPVLTERGENPAGFGGDTVAEDYNTIVNAYKVAPNHRNETTLQTYYNIAMWQPFAMVTHISPMPVLVLTAGNDRISLANNQKAMFDTMKGPKRMHIEPNKGHMDILSGESFPKLMCIMVDFVKGDNSKGGTY